MMLPAPPPSPYDLNLRLGGFDVRVSFTFWIGTVLFGFSLVQMMHRAMGAESPGVIVLMLMMAIAMLATIAIHELGHAVAFRMFGVNSRIVLYHMGGLAIPETRQELSPGRSLIVSAAGPAVQLVSAFVLAAVLNVAGYATDGLSWINDDLDLWFNEDKGALPIKLARAMVVFYVVPSVFWSLLNMVPVFPLDGGRVARSITQLFGLPAVVWMAVGMIAGGGLAYWAFTGGQYFMAMLFGALAMGNFQRFQASQQNPRT